jgi:hypothetical protein
VMPQDHKHQGHQQEQSKGKRDQILSPIFVFSVLLLPRLLAAQYSIIGDCDEGVPPPLYVLTEFSLQLLGADALSCPWNWVPDMGVFSCLCNTQLGLYRAACSGDQDIRGPGIYEGM